jgi:hypothetical protein
MEYGRERASIPAQTKAGVNAGNNLAACTIALAASEEQPAHRQIG